MMQEGIKEKHDTLNLTGRLQGKTLFAAVQIKE